MQQRLAIVGVGLILIAFTMGVTQAFAQEEAETEEIPIQIGTDQVVIVVVGIFGGLTTAYLGSRKAKSQDPNYQFDIHKFLDRVLMALISSVPLAFAAATDIIVLDIPTMFMVYLAAIGTAELTMELRNRNSGRKTT